MISKFPVVRYIRPDRDEMLNGNEQISSLNSEANSIKDQTVYYDIRFKAL